MQAQSHIKLPSASMNTMDYESTGYQSNPSVSYIHPGNLNTMNGCLNPSNHNQVETHTNSSYSHPLSFQTSSDPYSDMINYGPTDNHFQHSRTTNNRSISYILTHEPASHGYLVTKVEPTRTVWVSAADIDKILAVPRM